MIRPGSLASRLLALALLAGVLAVAALGVAAPLAGRWAQLEDQRAQAADMLARLRAIAAEHDARAAQLAQARKTITDAGLYLKAESRALAGARMGELVRQVVERHGGEVRSVRVVEGGEADQKAGRVALNVAMRGAWAQLFPVLHDLETGEPYLFMRSFTISARGRRRPGRTGDEETPVLELEFELYGYLPPEVSG